MRGACTRVSAHLCQHLLFGRVSASLYLSASARNPTTSSVTMCMSVVHSWSQARTNAGLGSSADMMRESAHVLKQSCADSLLELCQFAGFASRTRVLRYHTFASNMQNADTLTASVCTAPTSSLPWKTWAALPKLVPSVLWHVSAEAKGEPRPESTCAIHSVAASRTTQLLSCTHAVTACRSPGHLPASTPGRIRVGMPWDETHMARVI